MIFIRFADLGPSPREITGEIEAGVLTKKISSDEFSFLVPQIFTLKATSIPDGAQFKGQIVSKFEQVCGRCGKMRAREINIPVQLVVRRMPPRRFREEDGRYEDDIGITFVEGERFDLEPMLIELILLSLSTFWSEEKCVMNKQRTEFVCE
jgi:uncharacterized metal-binding protein YceD (DUF177 family)